MGNNYINLQSKQHWRGLYIDFYSFPRCALALTLMTTCQMTTELNVAKTQC